MGNEKPDVLHGSRALMVLRTLDTMGPQHGWGIARLFQRLRSMENTSRWHSPWRR